MQIGSLLASTTVLLTLLSAGSPTAEAQATSPWSILPLARRIVPMPDIGNRAPPAPAQSPPAPPISAPAAPSAQSVQPQTPIVRPEVPVTQQAEQPRPSTCCSPPSASPPAVTAQPMKDPDAEKRQTRTATAKAFAIDYLHSWSASNDAALEATAAFYAPNILFTGAR